VEIDRVQSILATGRDAAPSLAAAAFASGQSHALSIRGVEKSFGRDRGVKALRGVDLSVANAETVVLLGRSGSGKSTLLRCINRLVEPDAGSISLDGVEITQLSSPALRLMRRRIGMVFQEFNLVNRLTVLDNVLTGRAGSTSAWRCWFKAFPRDDVAMAESLLERVGLIDQRLRRADQLSGGQRQRVGIARALMQEPSLLLADEPTASLDPATGEEIMELICGIGATARIPIIVAIHDVDLAQRFADRLVALKGGSKIYDGQPDDVDLRSIYREFRAEAAAEAAAGPRQ